MKKIHLLFLSAVFSVAFTACFKNSSVPDSGREVPPSASSTAGLSETDDSQASSSSEPAVPVSYDTIDLDLTTQSPTMIYAQVFNMMLDPDSFNGKVIKLNGACAIFQDETLKQAFYACIVKDATACCAQGLEFVLSNEYSIDEYPTENADITIIGRFETYKLNGLDSFHLTGTKLVEQ